VGNLFTKWTSPGKSPDVRLPSAAPVTIPDRTLNPLSESKNDGIFNKIATVEYHAGTIPSIITIEGETIKVPVMEYFRKEGWDGRRVSQQFC
jgi:hypothetical protein